MIPDQLTCPECRASFSTPAELAQHNRTIHRRFACETCGQIFVLEDELDAHNQKMHPTKQEVTTDR